MSRECVRSVTLPPFSATMPPMVKRAGLCALVVATAVQTAGCAGPDRTRGAVAPGPATGQARTTRATPPCWSVQSIEAPALTLALPPGWQTRSAAEARELMLASVRAAGGDESDPSIAFIDAGNQRMMAIGLAPFGIILVTIRLLVIDGDADLEQAVERSKQLSAGITVTRRDVSMVTLPIGPASRAVELRQGNSRNITYVLLLDGRTLILTGTSREEDTGMIELMDTVAASLARPGPPGARQGHTRGQR
jgi:hypothetical protein